MLNSPAILVRVRFDGDLIGLGLFTESKLRRRGVISSTQLRLHQVGDNLLDQVWVEYNHLICPPEHQLQAMLAVIDTLDRDEAHWDELVISMMPMASAAAIAKHCRGVILDHRYPCYSAHLSSLRERNIEFLSSLSSNTRYQIRYSQRRYEKKYGHLELEVAQDSGTALAFFHEAGPLHEYRWNDSGYKNQSFVSFHESLIRNYLGNGVELIRICSGTTTIAICYYHVVGCRAYFYLHGLMFDGDPKLKPGLVAHSMAAQYFMNKGISVYDFMGGYSRYKLQLASLSQTLTTVRIQRPRIRFLIENTARELRHCLSSWRSDRQTTESREVRNDRSACLQIDCETTSAHAVAIMPITHYRTE